ncbi:MAG: hypothetical protein BHW65_02990 [Verrucomicrobia bacterium CAG:312_58_20]|nr:MAG: hypothetical protein BHW65_02990 [Verrucomicrobia bacterium CAG:312_58_20]
MQAQSRARRKFRPDCKIGIFRPRANSPALFAQLRPNQPPPQNRKNRTAQPSGKENSRAIAECGRKAS